LGSADQAAHLRSVRELPEQVDAQQGDDVRQGLIPRPSRALQVVTLSAAISSVAVLAGCLQRADACAGAGDLSCSVRRAVLRVTATAGLQTGHGSLCQAAGLAQQPHGLVEVILVRVHLRQVQQRHGVCGVPSVGGFQQLGGLQLANNQHN
jgi:hypothetical protein